MRICYVLTSLYVGGAEKQALAVADRMAKCGYEVTFMILKPSTAEEWPTRHRKLYLDMSRTPASLLAGLGQARRLVADFRPDLLHSHCFHANIFVRLLRLRLPGLTVISTIHNVNEGGRVRMLAYRMTDCLSRKTVAVSGAARDRFTRLKAVPAPKCVVIPNGIDVGEFVPDGERRAIMRAEMGVTSQSDSGEFVWLAVGRIVVAKDYPNLLRAFADVCEKRSNARLWIAGEDKTGDSAALKTLAANLRVTEKIRWLGLRRDVPALLNAADAFVSASAWEGMPLAVGEAMAMEKVVVATDVGGVRELVGDMGAVVSAANPGALANAMIGVMQRNCEERSAQGRAARSRIVNTFSVDSAAKTWEALYRDLIQ